MLSDDEMNDDMMEETPGLFHEAQQGGETSHHAPQEAPQRVQQEQPDLATVLALLQRQMAQRQMAQRQMAQQQREQQKIAIGLSQVIQQLGQQSQQTTPAPTQPTVPSSLQPTATTAAAPPPRQKLPKLAEFAGVRTEYKVWRGMAESKLSVDGDAIGDNYAKIALLEAALTGTAAQNATTFITRLKAGRDATPEELLEHLDLSWKNSHEAELALGKLQSMRQGNRPFHLFFAEFERTMADAEASEFPESSKKNYLRTATAEHVKELTYAQDEPATYEALARLYLQIAIRQDQAKKTKQAVGQDHGVHGGSGGDRSSAVVKPVMGEDAMDWESTNAVRIQAVNINGHPTGPGLPNDAQYRGKRAHWVDDQDRQKRHKEGRCLRCGRDGCLQRVCPLAAARRPRPVRANRQHVTEAEVEDETEKGVLFR